MLKTIFRLAGGRDGDPSKPRASPSHAYYVAPTEAFADIRENGICPGDDGMIHVYGKLACALAGRDINEARGVPSMVWRIDISGLACELDPEAEGLSESCRTPTTAEADSQLFVHNSLPDRFSDPNEFCHGYLITQPIPWGRIEGEVASI